ncbi:MAG TPA: homoserine dehydrogenase, partial [Acidobacteriota bacterium]|nr:homoserine dehydrogenase [Acidobacteriota bacterium]
SLARKHESRLLFESTVMDGAPVFNMARSALKGCRVVAVEGILNSTGNYVLTQIEQGSSIEEAILQAQQGGFAEADPSHDLEGWDSAAKISILARVLMGGEITPTDVSRRGFSALNLDEIGQAASAGTRIKFVARARLESGEVVAEVGPKRFPMDHPFATVDGTGNILRIETDLMCPLTIRQESPSVEDTAYGVLNDLMELVGGETQ